MPYIVLGLAVLVAVIDQVLKYLVVNFLDKTNPTEIIPNLFSLTYVENKGAAFGMLADARWIFITFTIIITAFLIYILFKKRISNKLFLTSVVLIIGGGIGNLIDRIFLGYVVDYLSISFFPPVCNFADYCITIGAVLLVIYILFMSDFTKKEKSINE
ncbi:MAG: signal peptidase II [Oscillospiraceae bacterium]|nr:signal peptidase II [Oscillospiraceae bacterium]